MGTLHSAELSVNNTMEDGSAWHSMHHLTVKCWHDTHKGGV